MTQPLDIEKLRNDFPMLAASDTTAAADAGKRALAYLDSASSSQTPEPVLAAMDAYYRTMRANVHRGMYRASEAASDAYEGARRKVADLIGARENEVVFTRGTTESLNLLAYALAPTLGADDEVVLTAMEHHANLVPWQQLALRYGFTVRYIPLRTDYELDMDAARAIIGPRTAVLSVTLVSNVLGTVTPFEELAALARAHDAVVIADAAQAVGHRKLDVARLGADFVAFSGHKMMGPTGIGVLWGRQERLAALAPFQYGGDMIKDVSFDTTTFNDAPWKFEAGTPNISGAIGLGAAADYVHALGPARMAAEETRLANLAIERIMTIPGARIIGPGASAHRTGVVSFAVEGIHPHDMATILDAEGVAVRGGHHCAMPLLKSLGLMMGTTRASFAAYNTEADVDALIRGIEKARTVLRVGA